MNDSISHGLQGGKVVLFSSPPKKAAAEFVEIVKQAQQLFPHIAILSYRRKPTELSHELAKGKVKTQDCFFIDVISEKGAQKDNVIIIHKPSDLNETNLAIAELLKTRDFHFLLIENPGELLAVHDYRIALRFLHGIIARCRASEVQLGILFPEIPENEELCKDLRLFADTVVNLSEKSSSERLLEAFQ